MNPLFLCLLFYLSAQWIGWFLLLITKSTLTHVFSGHHSQDINKEKVQIESPKLYPCIEESSALCSPLISLHHNPHQF